MSQKSHGMPLWQKLIIGCFGWLLKPRFIGGSDIASVLETGRKYREQGFDVSYDLMLEHVQDTSQVITVCDSLAELVSRMDGTNYGNVVIKPSMLGLHTGEMSSAYARALFSHNLHWLVQVITRRFPHSVAIEVDAEARSKLKDQYEIVAAVRSASKEGGCIRQALQMHHGDFLSLAKAYGFSHAPLRIVKGSGMYQEAGDPVVSDEVMHQQFYLMTIIALRTKSHPYIATMRDRAFIMSLIEYIEYHGYTRGEFTIEMLHGVGTTLAHELRDRGYTVRIYIPFVMAWCPDAWKAYVGRRIATFLKLAYRWFGSKCS